MSEDQFSKLVIILDDHHLETHRDHVEVVGRLDKIDDRLEKLEKSAHTHKVYTCEPGEGVYD